MISFPAPNLLFVVARQSGKLFRPSAITKTAGHRGVWDLKKSGMLGETAYQIYQNQEASSLISCNVSSAPSTDKMSQKEKLNPLNRPRFIFTAQ